MAGRYKVEPRGHDRDLINQVNKNFDAIEKDIVAAGKAGKLLDPPGYNTPPFADPAAFASVPASLLPQPTVNLPGFALQGNPPSSVLTDPGVSGPSGVSSSQPMGSTSAGAVTDGVTITGDGGGGALSVPISLVVPVALPDGGTGIVQAPVQQITTLGTLVAAETAQAQPALHLPGVSVDSAAAWSLPNAPDATWQTGIFVILVCTANTVTPYLVNPTAAGITPIAQLLNIKVIL